MSDNNMSEQQQAELKLFKCEECYVYKVPPSTTAGHRAELWNINEYIAAVGCELCRSLENDELAMIRLVDPKTGSLFAECPVPTDVPLITAIEPVIDSSRYYVIRIVDQSSGRHAFIGLGFREREESSDFNAALHDHLAYVRRKKEADAMREQYEQHMADGSIAPSTSLHDYSIQPGETLNLKLNVPGSDPNTEGGGFVSSQKGRLTKTFSLMFAPDGSSVAALAPPPGTLALKRPSMTGGTSSAGTNSNDIQSMQVSPSYRAGATDSDDGGVQSSQDNWGEFISPCT